MSIYRGPYYSASSCTGSARPGNKAIMAYYLGAYGDRGAANLGIYVCKRLGSGYSIHAEGRADDCGTTPYNDPGGNWPDWGWAFANALRLNSNELGVQLIIFRGKVWSCRYPDAGWRDYTGTDPHNGHLHVELTPTAAANLTVAKIQAVLSGTTGIDYMGGDMIGLKQGDQGEEVKALQGLLTRSGFSPGAHDGRYGSNTAAAVLAMRRSQGSSATDGINFTGAAYEQLFVALIKNQAPGGIKGDRGPAGPAGPAGKDGRDGVLKLPAAVAITGQVTSLGAGA